MNEKHKREIVEAKAKAAREKAQLAHERAQQENANISTKVLRILGALFYAVVSMTTGLSIPYALPIWIIATGILVFAALDLIPKARTISWHKKVALSVPLILLLLAIANRPIRTRYMEEKAEALTGEMHAAKPSAKYPAFEIGNSGTRFVWDRGHPPESLIRFAADNKFNLEVMNGQILVSTEIRDEYGNQIVEIARNRWKIPRGAPIVDKNYSADALEIKDRRGHVVFQMQLLSDMVHIQGEWHRERGGGTVFMQGQNSGDVINIPSGLKDKDMFPWSEVNIEPMFEYPSNEHWAEWRHRTDINRR